MSTPVPPPLPPSPTPPPLPEYKDKPKRVLLFILAGVVGLAIVGFIALFIIFLVVDSKATKERAEVAGTYVCHIEDDPMAEGDMYIIIGEDGRGAYYYDFISSFSGEYPGTKEYVEWCDTVKYVAQEILWEYDKKTGIINARCGRFDLPDQMADEKWEVRGDTLIVMDFFKYVKTAPLNIEY